MNGNLFRSNICQLLTSRRHRGPREKSVHTAENGGEENEMFPSSIHEEATYE